jgi:hypothetical protein
MAHEPIPGRVPLCSLIMTTKTCNPGKPIIAMNAYSSVRHRTPLRLNSSCLDMRRKCKVHLFEGLTN